MSEPTAVPVPKSPYASYTIEDLIAWCNESSEEQSDVIAKKVAELGRPLEIEEIRQTFIDEIERLKSEGGNPYRVKRNPQ